MDKLAAQRETEAGDVALGLINLRLVCRLQNRRHVRETIERRKLRIVQRGTLPLRKKRQWKDK